MRVIIYDDGQILVKRKAYRKKVLEYCKNNEVADKLAYWKYTCLPKFRKELKKNNNDEGFLSDMLKREYNVGGRKMRKGIFKNKSKSRE